MAIRKNLSLLLTLFLVAFSAKSTPASASVVSVSAPELMAYAAKNLSRVPELKFIRDEAEKLGVRAFLFGGTASGYLHYVKWDLQRIKKDPRYQGDRFDYDFTNIYRSTQDLDVVIDGPAEKIQQLENILKEKYPHFLGSKSAKWELRSLREAKGKPGESGYKEALLNDFDFMNQNTDSNSTGLIEVTSSHEAIVRDLLDWNNSQSRFLMDSAAGRISFIRSKTHKETSRAKAGQNPEIFSVIRALTKAFQYELEFDKKSMDEMQDIVDQFNAQEVLSSPVARHRIIEIGRKLFMHAVNLELSWNVLEKMGLRKKLMVFDPLEYKPASEVQTLAWWMNKMPLPSRPVGEGNEKTAAELGIDIIAHETRSFLGYESITRAHTGDANVFKSRASGPGEAAVHGDGFYTKLGTTGAAGTGLTIRFKLNSKARLNTDFLFVPGENYLVILNKKAITVIPESLNMTLLEYFKTLLNKDGNGIKFEDKGLLEKLKRKLHGSGLNTFDGDKDEILNLLEHEIDSMTAKNPLVLLPEWFQLTIAGNHPKLAEKALRAAKLDGLSNPMGEKLMNLISRLILSNPVLQHNKKLVKLVFELNPKGSAPFEYLMRRGEENPDIELLDFYLSDKNVSIYDRAKLLVQKKYLDHEKSASLIKKLLQNIESEGINGRDSAAEGYAATLANFLARNELVGRHPEWIKEVLVQVPNKIEMSEILKNPFLSHPCEVVALMIGKGWLGPKLIRLIGESEWAYNGNFFQNLFTGKIPEFDAHPISRADQVKLDNLLVQFISNAERWREKQDLLHLLITRNNATEIFISSVLSKDGMEKYPSLVKKILERQLPNLDRALLGHVLNKPEWHIHSDLYKMLFHQETDATILQIRTVLLSSPWNKDIDLLSAYILRPGRFDTNTALVFLGVCNKSDLHGRVSRWWDKSKLSALLKSIALKIDFSDDSLKSESFDVAVDSLFEAMVFIDFSERKQIFDFLLEKKNLPKFFVQKVLGKLLRDVRFMEHPDLVQKMIARGGSDYVVDHYINGDPRWVRVMTEYRNSLRNQHPRCDQLL